MTVALQNDISAAARLDTINALQPVSASIEVYQALIFTLMNDPNPGVRYQAVQALVGLAHEEPVRQGLRQALSEDINTGIRIEAFDALANYPDDKTLETFRQRINADSNSYIRTRAKSIVESSDLPNNHSTKSPRRI
jgi:HEAT repeat protein